VLRASATLNASGLSLGPSGSATGILSAVGRADLRDVVSLTPLASVTPTSFTLHVDWDGSYGRSSISPAGVAAYQSGFLGFRAAGFDPLQRGWSGWTWSNSTLPNGAAVDAQGNGAFSGSAARSTDGAGLLQTFVNGRSTFFNIPLSSASFDFNMTLAAETMLSNTLTAGVLVNGSLFSDFANTARISGFQVFQGTTDITDQVAVSFASGFEVPLGAPPAIAPEPATVVLLGSGLVLVAVVARRRRASV
jgi:hypothetical protein